MAKTQPKKNSSLPLLVGGLVVVLIVGLTGGGSPTPAAKKTGLGTMPLTTTKKKSGDVEYTKDDETAKFPSVDSESVNAFKPAIVKKEINASLKQPRSNSIPSLFVGGETGWTYTGNMTINGSVSALLENGGTGEGVFLKPGQQWKSLTLKKVGEDSIILLGPDGFVKTIYFNTSEVEVTAEVTPFNPNTPQRLAGQIGNGPVFAESNLNTLPAIEGFNGNNQTNGRQRRQNR